MLLKKLKLINFRNYINFEQEFNHLKTIMIGQNAQGKSNILEAVNILATSKSDRAERDSDLVFWNKDYALIFATIEEGEVCRPRLLNIALQINPGGRRKLKINSVAKKAPQADLLGNFFCVMFSCEDLYLIKGSPGARRKWLDSFLFQLDVKYHKTLQDYQKSTMQKNALLKQAREEGMPKHKLKNEIEIWNEQIVNSGVEVVQTRYKFIDEIEPIAREFLSEISKHMENLKLIYKSTIYPVEVIHELPLRSHSDKAKIKKVFIDAIQEAFEEEFARGQSIIGPHRDDLVFLINDKDARSFASQGQQRSIILAIKLAELKIIEERKKEIPVLLLDDVFAELDENRQDFLLHNLPENIQTFLTTTHISAVQKEFLKGAQILEIKAS